MYRTLFVLLFLSGICMCAAAQDSVMGGDKWRKNIIRYDLSGGFLFGVDKYIVFGYERVLGPHQTMSLNIGKASLPRLLSIVTDSFALTKDVKSTGFNISLDYRFYLGKENRYLAPHGLYVGPYISYNDFKRTNIWDYGGDTATQQAINTTTNLHVFTLGGEIGYQFIVWKRLAIDLVMIGPGWSKYSLHADIQNALSDATKKQLQDAIKQVITQRFPGMNYVFSDKNFDANGTIRTWAVGYRYIVHIGFVF